MKNYFEKSLTNFLGNSKTFLEKLLKKIFENFLKNYKKITCSLWKINRGPVHKKSKNIRQILWNMLKTCLKKVVWNPQFVRQICKKSLLVHPKKKINV